ncbi:Serine/threonine-protein kinase PrkC [BD1-7 clade bacterium]|uniref:Serine/threonine-protein kinase PrkC n=1 Tax=BD1-7 clade bacterium TaxID=2029982 RepID=A0A5S9QZV2_9GAMM|nr:Serine/threonine-protein kinase PrkC [BD1-7 clade bacterium]
MTEYYTGSALDHFRILRKIGSGGMGSVFLAEDSRLSRNVAIKLLHTSSTEDQAMIKHEAMLLAQLNHPNIVQVFEIAEAENEQIAVVMEYINGCTLQQYTSEKLLTLKRRLDILSQVAAGLAEAHAKGIVHLDLKTQNILVDKAHRIKITDFGGGGKEQDINTNNATRGSAMSLSPEQAQQLPLDYRSDLFSFGIIAFQLLSGEYPFIIRRSKRAAMDEIINGKPKSLADVAPHLPPELCMTVDQLLSKKPEERPQNAANLAPFFRQIMLSVTDDLEDLSRAFMRVAPDNQNRKSFAFQWKRLGKLRYLLLTALGINLAFFIHFITEHILPG